VVSDKAKALALGRILSGLSSPLKEAGRLGVNLRTVERWVAAKRAAAAAGSPAAPPPGDPPDTGAPENAAVPPEKAEKTELDTVLEAARGQEAAAAPAKPAPRTGWGPQKAAADEAKEDGRRRDAEEALKYLSSIKGTVVGLGGYMLGVPLTDERLEEHSNLSFFAEMAVEENAEDVGEIVREKLRAGPWVVIVILLLDLLASLWMTWKLAKEHAAKRPPVQLPPKEEKKPARKEAK